MKAKDITTGSGSLIATIKGSDGVTTYDLSRERDGSVSCDCPARKSCKHIKDFKFIEEVERKLTLLNYKGFLSFQSAGAFETTVQAIAKLREEWK